MKTPEKMSQIIMKQKLHQLLFFLGKKKKLAELQDIQVQKCFGGK